MRGIREQRHGERELAARSIAGEKRDPAARQPTDARQLIDRRPAEPGLWGRQLRRPRQRLAAETDPNRIDRRLKQWFLHLFLIASERRRRGCGGVYDNIERMFVSQEE